MNPPTERSRLYRKRHPERLQQYEHDHPERSEYRIAYLRERRARGRACRTLCCSYLGCDQVRYSRRQMHIHLHREHGLKRVLKCQRCGVVMTHLKHRPVRARARKVVSTVVKPPKLTRLQKLRLKPDREVTMKVSLKVPDREGFVTSAGYSIRKKMYEWLRLVEKPPNDLPLKDSYNIALLTAVVLFRERYRL